MSKTAIVTLCVLAAGAGLAAYLAYLRDPGGNTGNVSPRANRDDTPPGQTAAPAQKRLFDGWGAPAAAIVFSGEQHGYLEPCGCSVNQLGGLARRADLFRQIQERGWATTAFD